jgi:hypothetical protein
MGQAEYKDSFDWLKDECAPFPENRDQIDDCKNAYTEKYGLHRRFISAFVDCLNDQLKATWFGSFICVAIDEPSERSTAKMNTESHKAWNLKKTE